MVQDKIEELEKRLDLLHGFNVALFAGVKTLFAAQQFDQKTAFMLSVTLEQSRSALLYSGSDDQLEGFDHIALLLTEQAAGTVQS